MSDKQQHLGAKFLIAYSDVSTRNIGVTNNNLTLSQNPVFFQPKPPIILINPDTRRLSLFAGLI